MIDNVEALRPRRIVDARNVDEGDELAGRVVAQEGDDGDDVFGGDHHGQLAIGDFGLGDLVAELAGQVGG